VMLKRKNDIKDYLEKAIKVYSERLDHQETGLNARLKEESDLLIKIQGTLDQERKALDLWRKAQEPQLALIKASLCKQLPSRVGLINSVSMMHELEKKLKDAGYSDKSYLARLGGVKSPEEEALELLKLQIDTINQIEVDIKEKVQRIARLEKKERTAQVTLTSLSENIKKASGNLEIVKKLKEHYNTQGRLLPNGEYKANINTLRSDELLKVLGDLFDKKSQSEHLSLVSILDGQASDKKHELMELIKDADASQAVASQAVLAGQGGRDLSKEEVNKIKEERAQALAEELSRASTTIQKNFRGFVKKKEYAALKKEMESSPRLMSEIKRLKAKAAKSDDLAVSDAVAPKESRLNKLWNSLSLKKKAHPEKADLKDRRAPVSRYKWSESKSDFDGHDDDFQDALSSHKKEIKSPSDDLSKIISAGQPKNNSWFSLNVKNPFKKNHSDTQLSDQGAGSLEVSTHEEMKRASSLDATGLDAIDTTAKTPILSRSNSSSDSLQTGVSEPSSPKRSNAVDEQSKSGWKTRLQEAFTSKPWKGRGPNNKH